MKSNKPTYIPNELASAAVGGAVTSAEQVKDYRKQKNQERINQEVDVDINGTGTGLKDRMTALEEAGAVVIEGVNYPITTDPEEIQAGSEKIPLANAVGGLLNLQHNDTWIYVIIDKAQSILAGIKADGTIEWAKGVPTPVREYLEVRVPQLIEVWDNNHYHNSKDYIYAIADRNGRVIVAIEKDGSLFVGKSLDLSEQAMTDFQKALKDAGFRPGGQGDYSDTITQKGKKPVCIEMPRLALLNLVTEPNLNLSALAKVGTPKINVDVPIEVEFCDGKGVGFTKKAVISAQGNSSMIFPKKNISLKIFDKDIEKGGKWAKGDTFGICFGDWVMQKSWHLKSYYTDFLRGGSVIAYQLADEVAMTYDKTEDRPWKKALIPDFENPYPSSEFTEDNMALKMDNGARCQPDGFPVLVFQNGDFYGVYSWQIKKDADNYNMDTDEEKHIHLDGDLYASTIWDGNMSSADWEKFEIRCPEGLVTVDGEEYNGDSPKEISGTDPFSSRVKASIIALSGYTNAIRQAITINGSTIGVYKGVYNPTKTYVNREWVVSGDRKYMSTSSHNTGNPVSDTTKWTDITDTIASGRALFEQYFDIDSVIDYQLVNMAVDDPDGFGKNWQWITYDGVKWYVCEYDKDMAFGNHASGMFTRKPGTGWEHSDSNTPVGIATRLYGDVLVNRWVELRDLGLFTTTHINNLIIDWMSRIGQKNFEQEWKKWDESPCNRDSEIDENWEYAFNYTGKTEYVSGVTYANGAVVVYNGNIYKANTQTDHTPGTDSNWTNVGWNDATTYGIDDIAWVQVSNPDYCVAFRSLTANNVDNRPIPTQSLYTEIPNYLGYKDSAWRYFKFVEDNLANRNEFINDLL